MNPQAHVLLSGLSIILLGVGAHFRLRWHPRYTVNLLLNGLLYAIWGGAAVAWLPNLLPPLRALLAGEPLPVAWWQVGLDNWMLGLAGGAVAAIVYLRVHRLPVLLVLDSVAPLLALTLAVWRVGCAVNGDSYGRVMQGGAALWLPDMYGTYAWRFPSQYVSIAANLLIAGLLLALERWGIERFHRPRGWTFVGFLFWSYLALYSLQRFIFEFWRGDKPLLYQSFTATHVYATIGILLALWGFWHGRQEAIRNR